MRLPDPPRVLAGWRLIRVPLLLIVVYLVLHQVLSMLSANHGLGSPGGFALPYLVVTGLVLVLRVALLVVAPAVYAYRLVVWAVGRGFDRFGTPRSSATEPAIGEPGREASSTAGADG